MSCIKKYIASFGGGKDFKMSNFVSCRFILLSLAVIVRVNHGKLIRHPEPVTAEAGQTVEFVCQSTIFQRNIHWYLSESRQHSVRVVYHGTVEQYYKGKIEVSAEVVNNTIKSTLTMKDINLQDAGTVICREDESYGTATLSVVNVYAAKPNCSAWCGENVLHLSCSFCYKSENTLCMRWQLRGSAFIEEVQHYESNATGSNCIQHYSGATIEHLCREDDTVEMTIYDRIGNTSSRPYGIHISTQGTVSQSGANKPIDLSHSIPTNSNVSSQMNILKKIWSVVVFLAIMSLMIAGLLLSMILLLRRHIFRSNSTDYQSVHFRASDSSRDNNSLLPKSPEELMP